jgi:pimeloyl-ACP methyl ester carboxylesterase
MGNYVLVHGAASDSWYWHRVVPLLEERGHSVVAADLPSDNDSAGFPEYARAVAGVVAEWSGVTLVAQSMGAFTVPLVCDLVPVDLIVLVAPMIPLPGEHPGEWWVTSGQEAARRAFDVQEGRDPDAPFDVRTTFFHDVPEPVVAEAFARGERHQSGTPFEQPWPVERWPAVPTRVVAGRNDRLFPLDMVRRLSRDRLGITPDVIDSGHLPALSRPHDLVDLVESYRLELSPAGPGSRSLR